MMTEAFQAAFARPATEAIQSPGLGKGAGPAFELKFQLSLAEAHDVESWARQHLQPDLHGELGSYRITSVYCDTPRLDTFHRAPGFRRSKYRLRRYGEAPRVYLECKRRWGDRVKKKRAEVADTELSLLTSASPPEWAGAWFQRRISKRGLLPACRVTYHRTAFFGGSDDAPIRLTLDRNLAGAPATSWDVPLEDGQPLLPDGVMLEMKFHTYLPELFRSLLPRLPLQQGRVSKYRRCVQVCGLAENA
jgi:VTC domain